MPGRLDFEAIKEGVDVEAVAHELRLTLSKDGRTECPACKSSDRALEIIPETNTFRCWAAAVPAGKKCLGGDVIGLYAHVRGYQGQYRAAKELAEIFGVGGAVPSTGTSSTNRKDRANTSTEASRAETTAPAFGPEKFLAKLTYSEDLKSAGVSEEDATRLGIGYHAQRKQHYLLSRNPDGSPSGFTALQDLQTVKFPPQWLPSNVIPLRKKA